MNKNVFVMKSGGKSRWQVGDTYITTEQLKLRNKENNKIRKEFNQKPESLDETINDFRKNFPDVRVPYELYKDKEIEKESHKIPKFMKI